MSVPSEQIEYALKLLTPQLGCDYRKIDGRGVLMHPERDAISVDLCMPAIAHRVEFSGPMLARSVAGTGETILDAIENGRDRLFADVQAHIAKHGDSRVRQLTEALREALVLLRSRSLAYGPDDWAEIARLHLVLG